LKGKQLRLNMDAGLKVHEYGQQRDFSREIGYWTSRKQPFNIFFRGKSTFCLCGISL